MPYVPIEWLREHVDVPSGTTAEQLAADLVKVGLEEEQIVPPAVTGPLVVGRVLTRDAKEQSNGKVINYCRVDVGAEHNDAPGTGRSRASCPAAASSAAPTTSRSGTPSSSPCPGPSCPVTSPSPPARPTGTPPTA